MFWEALLLASVVGVATPVQTGWRPIGHPVPPPVPVISSSSSSSHASLAYQSHIPETADACTLYKAVLDQDSPSQYVQYKTPIPDMKEFTLCHWHKFYNHSQDQPIFAYSSAHGRPRDIYSWVSNSDRSSFYMLSVMGHTLYRLNYPVRLNKWYHACQSWNGRTGEWQIWVNSERIGRGFYNLLVGKGIKGGGVAVSGQESNSVYDVDSYFDQYKPRSGLLGEVTLLQLYKAALTAGKAYTNHKHHHAHHFHHDDKLEEDDLRIAGIDPAAMPEGLQLNPDYPFLRHGQLIQSLPVQELSALRAKNQFNPQMNILSQNPFYGQTYGTSDPSYSLQQMRLYKREQKKEETAPRTRLVTRVVRKQKSPAIKFNEEGDDIDEVDQYFEKLPIKRETEEGRAFSGTAPLVVQPAVKTVTTNVEREKRSKDPKPVREEKDEQQEGEKHEREKRSTGDEEKQEKVETKENSEREKRSGDEDEKDKDEHEVMSTQETSNIKSKREGSTDERVHKKRTALLGGGMPFGVIPGADLSGLFTGDGYILGQGGLRFDGVPQQQSIEKEQEQMEPAEWEVRSIMAVCSGCSEDPFRKASIVSWRETPKKLYSGVLYIPASPECQRF